MNSGIYEIVNKVNGKKYIGSAKNIKKRWEDHKYYLRKGNHHSILLQRAWKLHGENSFEFHIIEIVENVQDLTTREQHYLDEQKTYEPDIGYNLCRNANSMLGYKYSEEQKKWMSENRKGEKNQHYGKKHSEETKRMIGEKNRNKVRTEEQKAKLAEIGRKYMQELKENNPEEFNRRTEKIRTCNKGKKLSEETRKKLSEIAKKRTGTRNPSSKLNYEIAQKIREEYTSKLYMIKELAEKYKVCTLTIKEVLDYKRWKTPED